LSLVGPEGLARDNHYNDLACHTEASDRNSINALRRTLPHPDDPAEMKNAAPSAKGDGVESNYEAAKLQTKAYPKEGASAKPKALSRQQRWRKRNPKAYLAHLAVKNALNLDVIEQQPCRVCGATKSEAHHPDYDRPFDVIWLCRKHHKAHHAAQAGA